MAGNIIRRLQQLVHAAGQSSSLGRLADRRLDDGEFIAAEPCDRVRVASRLTQPFRHGLQQ